MTSLRRCCVGVRNAPWGIVFVYSARRRLDTASRLTLSIRGLAIRMLFFNAGVLAADEQPPTFWPFVPAGEVESLGSSELLVSSSSEDFRHSPPLPFAGNNNIIAFTVLRWGNVQRFLGGPLQGRRRLAQPSLHLHQHPRPIGPHG
jgi:hypothetical protein